MASCDIAEDVGIAYGYNNIPVVLNLEATVGGETRLNKLSDMVREEVAHCGFVEFVNFVLCSVADLSSKVNKPQSEDIVRIGMD